MAGGAGHCGYSAMLMPSAVRALKFNGSGDYVAIKNLNYSANTYTATFECWFKTRSDGIICSYDRSAFYRVEVGGSLPSGEIGCAFAAAGTIYDWSTGVAPNGTGWRHFAFIFDNGAVTMMVDGTVERTGSTGSYLQPSWGETPRYGFLGTGSEAESYDGTTGPDDWLDGDLREVRIWSAARTEQEIQDNMHNRLTGAEAGLVLYYPFDEGAGGTLHDASGNGNDGTVHGADWVVERISE